MSGGGARAAYQVGFLHFLAQEFPELSVDILTGVSAGAVNAAYLASSTGPLSGRAERLFDLWRHLGIDDVFGVETSDLAKHVLRWGVRLLSGGGRGSPPTTGLVETDPLRELLHRALDAEGGVLKGVERNLQEGTLKAVAITASSYTTGQSITWVRGRQIDLWERAHRKSISCPLTVEHVMASSALPIFFPAIPVEGAWYGDGGIRLTAPLSPAVHLGADRILAISTRYPRHRKEADLPAIDGYPPPAQVAGVLLNAIFLDLFDGDALRLERINRLIEHVEADKRGGLRKVELLVLRPSQDLGKLANEFETQLPPAFRFLTRGLGTRETRSNDLLSLIMFQPDYLHHLLDLGESDARARRDEIARFLRLPRTTGPEGPETPGKGGGDAKP